MGQHQYCSKVPQPMKLGYGAPFLVRGSMFLCRHVWLLHPCTISFKSRGHKLSNLPRLRQTKVGKAKKLVLKNRKNHAKPTKSSKIVQNQVLVPSLHTNFSSLTQHQSKKLVLSKPRSDYLHQAKKKNIISRLHPDCQK